LKLRQFSRSAQRLCLASTLAIACAGATAKDIAWIGDAYSDSATLAPGKIAERCGEVDPRNPVNWKFAADGALQFNIHRHAGNDVIYASRSYNTRELNGTFKPNARFEWCWMWTNETASTITLRIDMKRE
jgi:hypothetical protein